MRQPEPHDPPTPLLPVRNRHCLVCPPPPPTPPRVRFLSEHLHTVLCGKTVLAAHRNIPTFRVQITGYVSPTTGLSGPRLQPPKSFQMGCRAECGRREVGAGAQVTGPKTPKTGPTLCMDLQVLSSCRTKGRRTLGHGDHSLPCLGCRGCFPKYTETKNLQLASVEAVEGQRGQDGVLELLSKLGLPTGTPGPGVPTLNA